MYQETDAHWKRSWNRNFGGMQQGYDVPSILLCSPGRECGIQIAGHGEHAAYDVVGLEVIRLDESSEQLIGRCQDFLGAVLRDGRCAANPVESD